MKIKFSGLICLLLLSTGYLFLAVFSGQFPVRGEEKEAAPAEWREYKLTYSTDWNFLKKTKTTDPRYYTVRDNYIWLFNEQDKSGFQCVQGDDFIKVDVDGDGQTDKNLRRRDNFVDYKLSYGMNKNPYRLRIWRREFGPKRTVFWLYQRACFMKGRVAGQNFILIDDNNNGRYNDFGADAVLIGKNKEAGLLSSLIEIKGKYYELKINDVFGNTVQVREYQGPSGKIDVKSKLKLKKLKPSFVTLADKKNDIYLTVSTRKKTSKVPVGNYELYLAVLTDRIRVRHGTLPIIKVEADQVTTLEWGGPFKLDCEPKVTRGGTIMDFVPPTDSPPTAPEFPRQELNCPFIKIELPDVVGQYGEEYFGDPQFKDPAGFCFPDAGVTYFSVEITAEESRRGKKKKKYFNRIGRYFVDNWRQLDPSGVVEKSIPWWQIYECPLYDYRGPVHIKVWIQSPVFGKIEFEQDLMVKD